jgi:hypothetical protein
VRGVLALVVSVLFVSAAAATLTYDPPEIRTGTVTSTADGSTLVAVQGWHVDGQGNENKPARLVSFDANGNVSWVYDGSKRGATWFYDVDPLPNGNVLVVNTIREEGVGKTLVYEIEPGTGERVWQVKFNITDTHDVDLINGDQLLVANMREWDGQSGTSTDRLFVYDLAEERIVWEWYFANHYPASTDGGMDPDWTHVNDVDKVGPGRYMASPRNFDQVIVVDRETKDVTLRLARTTTTTSCTSNTTRRTSKPTMAGRSSWSPTPRTTASSSTPVRNGSARNASGSAPGRLARANSTGHATRTDSRTGTR